MSNRALKPTDAATSGEEGAANLLASRSWVIETKRSPWVMVALHQAYSPKLGRAKIACTSSQGM